MKRPYLLFKRGHLWYYRLAGEKTFHTTGQRNRNKAEAYVVELLRSNEGHRNQRHMSFRRYAQPFFDWDRCPHIRRLREEGKSITRRHVKIQNQRLKKHILPDPFADKRLSEITRADVLDLRSRLLVKCSPATVNKALGIVKVIFREALYREEINRDPTAGVGKIKERKKERGIFTGEELRVSEAWKGGKEIGPPKWDHNRLVPLSPRTIEKLSRLQNGSIRISPDDFVFCYDNGLRFGETWWRKRFCTAMERAGIDRQTRRLTPHSFRHTINTIVRDSGHDPAKIRAVLGWMEEVVQDDYTHWDLDHLKAWADIVDEIWQE